MRSFKVFIQFFLEFYHTHVHETINEEARHCVYMNSQYLCKICFERRLCCTAIVPFARFTVVGRGYFACEKNNFRGDWDEILNSITLIWNEEGLNQYFLNKKWIFSVMTQYFKGFRKLLSYHMRQATCLLATLILEMFFLNFFKDFWIWKWKSCIWLKY